MAERIRLPYLVPDDGELGNEYLYLTVPVARRLIEDFEPEQLRRLLGELVYAELKKACDDG